MEPPQQRIKLATVLPRGTSTHQTLLEMAAKWRGAGVASTLYTDAVMGGEAETVRRMRIDQIQGAVLSVAGLMEVDHSVTALQLMPMMFRSLDEVEYVRERLRPLLEKRLEEKGFVVLFWADAGWVRFFTKKPVLHPDDLRKQKVFALTSDSGQSDLMKAAGFQPVPLEYTDTLTGLQTGLIDAVPTAPFYALAGQFYLPAPYMLEINYAPLVGGLVVTRKAWDALPAAARDAMRQAAEEAGKKISHARTPGDAGIRRRHAEARDESDAVDSRRRKPNGAPCSTASTPRFAETWCRPMCSTKSSACCETIASEIREPAALARAGLAGGAAASRSCCCARRCTSASPTRPAIVQHLTLVVGMMGAAVAARDNRLLALSRLGDLLNRALAETGRRVCRFHRRGRDRVARRRRSEFRAGGAALRPDAGLWNSGLGSPVVDSHRLRPDRPSSSRACSGDLARPRGGRRCSRASGFFYGNGRL